MTARFKYCCNSSTTVSTDLTVDTSINAPLAVRILAFGPLLHLPKQFTPTTGIFEGVKNVKVANVASLPFSLQNLFVQTKTCGVDDDAVAVDDGIVIGDVGDVGDNFDDDTDGGVGVLNQLIGEVDKNMQ